ncbi:MAG: hypothetical protein RSB00_03340 [Bacilli bacterium]
MKKINNIINKLKEKNIFFYLFMLIFIGLYIKRLVTYEYINTYTLSYYRITYTLGFLSRALVGSIFDILGIITKTEICIFITFINFSFMIIMSSFLNNLIKKYKNNLFILVALLFIFNTASITNIYSFLEFGRLDIFICLAFIISMYLIYKDRLEFIPIISLVTMLIHENFLMWCAPVICALLLYKFIISKNKKYLYTLIINIIVLLILFITTRFIILKPNYENAHILTNKIQEKSDFTINEIAIRQYYYMTKEENHTTFNIPFSNQNILDWLVAAVGFIFLFTILSVLCFYPLLKKSKHKFFFIILILSCFTPIILYFRVSDFGRWYVYIINNLLILSYYLFITNKELLDTKQNNKILFLYIFIYLIFSCYFYPNKNFDIIEYNHTDKLLEMRDTNGK